MVMKLNKMVFDDKKIEEAARGAADLYEQDLPMMSYDEDTEVDGQHHFCQEFGAELFKDGAKWAINEFLKNLWHDASETPDLDRRILYEYKPNGVINPQTHIREATYEKIRWKECGYKPINPERIITRWLYVDELCPKKGGDGK